MQITSFLIGICGLSEALQITRDATEDGCLQVARGHKLCGKYGGFKQVLSKHVAPDRVLRRYLLTPDHTTFLRCPYNRGSTVYSKPSSQRNNFLLQSFSHSQLQHRENKSVPLLTGEFPVPKTLL